MQVSMKTVSIESLGPVVPVIPEEAVGFYVQNCIVCFGCADHHSGVRVPVTHYASQAWFRIVWQGEFTEELRRQYGDLNKATDHAACAIALLLTPELTDYTGVEQSAIGTTIDYYLAPKDRDFTHIFSQSARLEVSGILVENRGHMVNARVQTKLDRLMPDQAGHLPTFIFVVEFSTPRAVMVES